MYIYLLIYERKQLRLNGMLASEYEMFDSFMARPFFICLNQGQTIFKLKSHHKFETMKLRTLSSFVNFLQLTHYIRMFFSPLPHLSSLAPVIRAYIMLLKKGHFEACLSKMMNDISINIFYH